MEERIEEASKSLKRMLGFETRQMEVFEKASTIRFQNKDLKRFMASLFGGEDKITNPKTSQRLKNQVKEFAMDVDTSIDEQGQTLWALFNAVTRYTNHTRKTKEKDYSLMFGTDAKLNRSAYQILVDSVKEVEDKSKVYV
jgi:hypothetical protein